MLHKLVYLRLEKSQYVVVMKKGHVLRLFAGLRLKERMNCVHQVVQAAEVTDHVWKPSSFDGVHIEANVVRIAGIILEY